MFVFSTRTPETRGRVVDAHAVHADVRGIDDADRVGRAADDRAGVAGSVGGVADRDRAARVVFELNGVGGGSRGAIDVAEVDAAAAIVMPVILSG